VTDINLSGFEGVVFQGYYTIFNPKGKTNITLKNCKQVKFEGMDFQKKSVALDISGADIVSFYDVWHAGNICLKTQKCKKIAWDNSGLTFDTANVKADVFDIQASQIDVRKLDMTGIAERILINRTNVFDVKEFIVRDKNVELFLDSTYDAKRALEQVLSYQR
jgi:hypothetical protein